MITSRARFALRSRLHLVIFAGLAAWCIGAIGLTAANAAPNLGVISVSLTPSTVVGGKTSAALVTMSVKSPKGGAVVSLKSSSKSATVPATVKIAAGSTSASFTVKTSSVTGLVSAQITAKYKTLSTLATLTLTPPTQASHYTTSTIVMNLGCTRQALLGVSHDGTALVFDDSIPCVSQIASGKVLLLQKLGVLKVLGTVKAPQKEMAVAVSSAAFTDFIQDGTFQIFSQQLGSSSMPSGFGESAGAPNATAAGGWQYSVHGSGSGGAVQYSFTASKNVSGLIAKVDAKGQAQGGYNFLAVIHGAKVQTVRYTTPTDGNVHVDWVVQISGPNSGIGEQRLRLPPLWSSLVDSADDVPLLFQVYANLIFKPGFGEKKAVADGSFDVTYAGQGGFDTTQPVNNGLSATANLQKVTSTALAAHGVVTAINAPKFALSLSTDSFLQAVAARDSKALSGANTADTLEKQLTQFYKPNTGKGQAKDFFKVNRAAYVMWVASIAYAGPGSVSTLPCQQFYENFDASAGADNSLLGTNSLKAINGTGPGDLAIFKDAKTVINPNIPACGP